MWRIRRTSGHSTCATRRRPSSRVRRRPLAGSWRPRFRSSTASQCASPPHSCPYSWRGRWWVASTPSATCSRSRWQGRQGRHGRRLSILYGAEQSKRLFLCRTGASPLHRTSWRLLAARSRSVPTLVPTLLPTLTDGTRNITKMVSSAPPTTTALAST